MDRRAEVRPIIASLIQRLALTKAQIKALPNTLEATVESGGFARAHDPGDHFKPFLPADLYSIDSSWFCFKEAEKPISAFHHTRKLDSRSIFLQFMNHPQGRSKAREYIEESHRREEFPVGTQFALIEQAFLISNENEIVLSPLIVSVQIRAYLEVDRRARKKVDGECVAEFVMQPRELMKGNAVMKPHAPTDYRFDAGQVDCGNFSHNDPFEGNDVPRVARLNQCIKCHGGAGGHSVATFARFMEEGNPTSIANATSAQKREDETWEILHKYFRVD